MGTMTLLSRKEQMKMNSEIQVSHYYLAQGSQEQQEVPGPQEQISLREDDDQKQRQRPKATQTTKHPRLQHFGLYSALSVVDLLPEAPSPCRRGQVHEYIEENNQLRALEQRSMPRRMESRRWGGGERPGTDPKEAYEPTSDSPRTCHGSSRQGPRSMPCDSACWPQLVDNPLMPSPHEAPKTSLGGSELRH